MLAQAAGRLPSVLQALQVLPPLAAAACSTRQVNSSLAACRQHQAQPQAAPQWGAPQCAPQPPNAMWAFREYMPTFKGLLVDAAGTLLCPAEPAAEVYLRIASKYGCSLSPQEVLERFRYAYNSPWGQSTIRYVGDGRAFWRHIVHQSTGCSSEAMFEELYTYYARGDSYFLMPGAAESLQRIRARGIRTALVSNFDTRLRRILRELGADGLFDALAISAEVGAEKPNPVLFGAACAALGLPPEQCVHVGDDRRNDLYGARDAGCFAWLWGQDVYSFAQVERRLETGNIWDSLDGV